MIIITLGTLSAYRGLSLVVNNSRAVVPPDKDGLFFAIWGEKLFGFLPVVAIAFLGLGGPHAHRPATTPASAIAPRPWAATLTPHGCRACPWICTRIMVLVLMGLIAGLAGVIFLGFRGAIDPTSGDAFLLPVIAAVIIGGTPLSGGRGSIFGAVLGALIIQVVQSGILFLGIDAKWSIFVTGAVIVIAVAIDQIVRRQRARRARDVVDSG